LKRAQYMKGLGIDATKFWIAIQKGGGGIRLTGREDPCHGEHAENARTSDTLNPTSREQRDQRDEQR
jgi:hypothetical protein